MSNINRLVQTGASALRAHTSRMATTQHNVANASTPGYRRQEVTLSTIEGRYGDGAGPGALAGSLRSLDNPMLAKWGMPMLAEMGQESALGQIAAQTEGALIEIGLGQRTSAMFGSMRALSAQPTSGPLRQQTIDRVEDVARGLRDAHTQLSAQRQHLQHEVKDRVAQVNGWLEQIAALDAQVVQGAGPDVIDARDELVERVAQQLDVRVVAQGRGGISLHTSQGVALVEGQRAATLTSSARADGSLGLAIDRSPGRPLALNKPGGQLGGMMRADAEVIGASLSRLDTQAQHLMQELNAVHQGGFGLDGQTGRPLLTGAAGPGLAGRIAVNAELVEDPRRLAVSGSVAGLPGDNTQIKALIDLEGKTMPNGMTLTLGMDDMSAQVGRVAQGASLQQTRVAQGLEHLYAMRESVRGVSLEEEMIAMEQARRALEASTKLIKVGQQAMDSVMDLLR